MKFVLASYVFTKEYSHPEAWLSRIKAYIGILEALYTNGNEITSVEQINYEGDHSKNGVNYHFLKLSKLAGYFPFTLHGFIKDQRPDVVIIQGLHFPLQVIQLRLKLGRKAKIIVHHHAEKPSAGIKKYFQRLADQYIDAYLFASHNMGMGWAKKGLISANKIHEAMEVSSVFYPIEKAVAISKTGITGDPVFLWVGRLNANKDPITVVKAFLKFVSVWPSAKLYMIYHTADLLAEITEVLNNDPNKNSIVLIGKVPNDELLYWYNSADFFISGSHYEGSGTAVCEAISCGCVPIVTNIDAFRMTTDSGKCGLLYEAGNQSHLLSALSQTQQINKAEKRDKCLSYYRSNLSFEAIADRIQEIAAAL